MIKFRLKYTNCYLIPIDSNYILIDTGYDWEWDLFQQKLSYYNVAISSISHLILTHHHDDHSGLLNNLIELNPQLIVVVSQTCAEYLKLGKHVHSAGFGYINKTIGFIMSFKGRFDKKWTHTFPKYKYRDNDILIHGEIRLQDIGIGLNGRIIETPGHSTDSISVILDNGICFCGDAAANFLQFAGTKYCIISVDNWDEYYNSWEKIINLNANMIYPAHGTEFNVIKLKKNLRKNKKENMVLLN
jgi:glyoxylase-like metal-dependent hydrolase (beta-lactamase superfamily II)